MKLILMRGVSGSGKSTLAKKIASDEGGVVFSTDEFHYKDGIYQYDQKNSFLYHQKNVERTEDAMKQNVSLIIVDNTNTRAIEMKAYVLLADKYGYSVIIKQPGDPDFPRVSLEELISRQNTRGDKKVPQEIVESMYYRFEENVSLENIRNSFWKNS